MSGSLFMTQFPCTRRLNRLRGTTIRTSPSSILWLLAQLTQVVVIHLATDGSRGAAATLSQSLSSQASIHSSRSTRASNQCRIGPSNINKTRTSGNFLVNVASVGKLETKHRSVGLSNSKPAEVTSLKASSHNPSNKWGQDHIIREMSKRSTCEE